MALTKINTNLIANNTIALTNIADNAIDATKIASNSILTRHIDDDQITGDQLTDNIAIAGTLGVTGATTLAATRVNGDFTVGAASGEDKLVIAPQAAGSGTIAISYNNAGNAYEPYRVDAENFSFRPSGTEQLGITGSGITVAGTLGVTGAITGNVTGNASGTAATVTGAAQTAITSVGTLSSLAVGNITTTGYLAGPASFVIDPTTVGDNTGTVVIAGSLQVDGTTTTINSTTLTVDDLKITVAEGAGSSSAANEAGIEVGVGAVGASSNPSILYTHATTSWDLNKPVNIAGTLGVTGVLTADAGIDIDNFNIDGTTIALSSGDQMTLDSPGRIDLSADDNGEIRLYDGSSMYAQFKDDDDRLSIQGLLADKDILFVVNDGGTPATALKLDAANAGAATFYGATNFNSHVYSGNNTLVPVSNFADQTGIALKYSTTVPEIQVSSDSVAMQLGRTSTGGSGQILALRAASNTKHSFTTTGYDLTGTLGVTGATTLSAATISSTTNMLLTLNPTAGNYGGIVFKYDGTTKGASIFNSGNMVYGGEASVGAALQAGGQYGLFVHPTTRNVGIGNALASPSYKLEVTGTFRATDNASIGGTLAVTGLTNINNSNNTWGRLNVHENSATVASLVLSQGSGSGNALEINDGNTDGGGSLFKVSGAGNITAKGIETTTRTDISLAADVGVLSTTTLENSSAIGLNITYPTSNVAAGDGIGIAMGVSGRGRSYIANKNVTTNLDASNLVFYTEGGGTIYERMIINTEGKVGIGETSPKGWLHIKEGSSGLSGAVNSNFDQLVLEDDSHCGMTILSSTGGDGAIYFGDSGGNNRGQFKYQHNGDYFSFTVANGATNARIDADGLKFHGDTAAANALDEYEEGTFTPVLKGYYGNTSLTVTQGTRSGYYTKIGNVVHIRIHFDGAGIATSGNTDIVAIGGLPFTITSGSEGSAPIVAHLLTLARTDMGAWNNLGAQELGMLTSSSGGGGWGWELCSTFATANVALRISMTYRTAT